MNILKTIKAISNWKCTGSCIPVFPATIFTLNATPDSNEIYSLHIISANHMAWLVIRCWICSSSQYKRIKYVWSKLVNWIDIKWQWNLNASNWVDWLIIWCSVIYVTVMRYVAMGSGFGIEFDCIWFSSCINLHRVTCSCAVWDVYALEKIPFIYLRR